MPRRVVLLSLLLLIPLSADAAPIWFSATLTGPQEEPPNGSPGTGTALVEIDSVAHTMRVLVDFAGLTAGNTASHIHVINGPGDVNLADTLGPVATTTPTFAGFPTGATAGSFDQTFDMTLASSYRAGWITSAGGTTALAEAALFAGILDGRAYLNIHTSTFPGGEIRGFLVPAPEPVTGVLTLAAIGAFAWHTRRQRHRRASA